MKEGYDMKSIWIYLENGTFLEAKSFGAEGTITGELVFNTSLSGYQEIATDPSYAGQFVLFTMPEIGNVGVNENDMESNAVHASGFVVRNYQERYSNYRGERSFADILKEHGRIGICDIDTRFLTKMLRDGGALMMVASTEVSEKDELKKILDSSPRIEEIDYIEKVSTKVSYTHPNGSWDETAQCYKEPKTTKKIVTIDFGVKRNILNELTEAGLEVEVVPHDFDPYNLIQRCKEGDIQGVFLSNGPGDPLILKEVHEKIKSLIAAKVPMFGICLGHQLLSIAHGYETYKLKFGHHGGNHPVKSGRTGAVEITAQNHNYNVPEAIEKIATVTHTNLFDGTIEGIVYKDSPIFSVQHHPEASPGPHESKYIFKEFANTI
jgi:carbamoyl-phosphate synthase small subunit